MAIRSLNSIGGFSVGEDATEIISSTGNITAASGSFTGNVSVLGLKTDNYYYANGSPIDFSAPAGANRQLQFNDGNSNFGASANLTFDTATNILQIIGNITADNANLGNVASANYLTGTLTTSAQPNITSLGNLTELRMSGNIIPTANMVYSLGNATHTFKDLYLSGNTIKIGSNSEISSSATGVVIKNDAGGTFTVISAGASNSAAIQYGTSSVIVSDSNNIDFTSAGNATFTITGVGANVTGVLGVSANANAGNFNTTGVVIATGNITGGNLKTAAGVYSNTANVSLTANVGNLESVGYANVGGNANVGNLGTAGLVVATGNVTGGNLVTANGLYSAIASVTGNANVGNLGTAGLVVATGNITGGNLVTSNTVYASSASITNTATVGNLVSNGYANVTGNVIGGNLTTAGLVSATGNVSGGNLTTDGLVSATGNVSGGNLTTAGLVSATGNITGGNLVTSGIANIATLSVTGTSNLNSVSNIYISGGNSGEYLMTNGAGVLSWNVAEADNISNGNSNITIATSGGNVTTSVAGNANIFVVTGTGANVSGYLTATGNANVGNLGTSGLVVATGNVSGGNLVTANGLFSSTASVTGNANVGNLSTAGLISATGNVSGGNLTTAGIIDVTGNASVGNLSTAGLISATGNVSGGNLTTAGLISAIGNVTSGNLVTANGLYSATASVSGNASIGNISSAGVLEVVGNITSNANVITNNLLGRDAGITLTAVGTNQNITLVPTGTGTVSVSSKRITSVATPTTDTDAATKKYVDDTAQGLNVKASVVVSTTVNLAATYYNGTAGVGATLTANAVGVLTLDGQTASTLNERVLIKDQTSELQNGIYIITTVGTGGVAWVLTRSADMSTPADFDGAFTFISTGIVNGDTGWVQTGEVVTIGTSPVVWAQFSSAGAYTAGTGLTLTGHDFSISNTAVTAGTYGNATYVPTFTVNAQGQLTYATETLVSASANSLTGDTLSSNVLYSSLTSLGTLGNLNVTANANVGNVYSSGIVSAIGNVSGSNVTTAGLVSATGNITGGNFITAGLVSATGNVSGGNLTTAGILNVTGNAILPNISTTNITTISTDGNLTIDPNGSGIVIIANTSGGSTGIAIGDPTQGNLVSNAVTMTNSTSVTNGIALLNNILGKLVPPAPPNFPASQSITVASLSTYRMANYTQNDNTPGANKSVAGGTSVSTVRRASSYSVNTITNAGPGDTGTISVGLNGATAGSRALTAALDGNGTYSNLIITNNYDYHVANANIVAGFWSVFTSQASGTVTQGWNEVYIADSATSNTNTYSWFYDSSSPGAVTFTNASMTAPVSPSYAYSSTVPHYDNTNAFAIGVDVSKLSGNMYPTSNAFISGGAGGAFGQPVSKNYADVAGLTVPLPQNYLATGNIAVSTTSTVISGFSYSSTGPTIYGENSYTQGSISLTSALGANILYKTGTVSSTSRIEEANIYISSAFGDLSGVPYRIVNPGSSNTPTYTGTEAAFNSQTGTLLSYDATIVANVLKHDQTNYSTGYNPVGPDLSAGRSGSQYFTFKVVRQSVSKFDVVWSGNIAGLWVALPGSTIDTTSSANGWIDMSQAYLGSGIPGANSGAGGNGSDGCSLGGVAPLNSSQSAKAVTATFGTVSSSSTTSNEIYMRIKLVAGQTVTALYLKAASN